MPGLIGHYTLLDTNGFSRTLSLSAGLFERAPPGLICCVLAPLTGVRSVVLGVFLQLIYVHLHAGSGRTLHHTVDVLSGQGQRQPLPTPTNRLVVQDRR